MLHLPGRAAGGDVGLRLGGCPAAASLMPLPLGQRCNVNTNELETVLVNQPGAG